jgi:heptosyltransferase I
VLRLSAIGDVCNAVAVVQAIQRHYPQAAITWVVGKVESQLLQGLPGVRLVVFDKRQGWRAYVQLWRELRGQRFDALLHMQVALRANLASLCIRAQRKMGFDWRTAKELHALFMRERVAPVQGKHVLDGFREFARAIGVPMQAPQWAMPMAPEHHAWAQQRIQNSKYFRHLVVCPAASASERNWLVERYAAVVDHAAKHGFAIWLCGGPTETEHKLAQAIVRASHTGPQQLFNLVGQTHLQQLLALMQKATLVLAPDSGPAHMATSVGTPVIGLYGHSNPARTGPYGSPYVVEVYQQHLQAQKGAKASSAKWGTRVKGSQIMQSISIQAVTDMFDRVVKDLSPNKAIFLDRDGVINVDHGYVYLPEQFEFIDGVFEACQHFQALGYKIIVVTNQSGIARGYYTQAQFDALNQWMLEQFAHHGVHITAVYHCPHHPNQGVVPYVQECQCRKPKPGMLLRAITEHNIDPAQSIMVGDKAADMMAATAAGVGHKVLVQTGQPFTNAESQLADEVLMNLFQASKLSNDCE